MNERGNNRISISGLKVKPPPRRGITFPPRLHQSRKAQVPNTNVLLLYRRGLDPACAMSLCISESCGRYD